MSDDQPAAAQPKLSYDNRSPDFPDFLEDDDEGDVTFGR